MNWSERLKRKAAEAVQASVPAPVAERNHGVKPAVHPDGSADIRGLTCQHCHKPLNGKGQCWKCCERLCRGCGQRWTSSAFIELCSACSAEWRRQGGSL